MKPKVSEWEKELDITFHSLFEGKPVMTGSIRPMMRDFIKHTLDQQKAELVEMVRGMKCGGYYGCPRCGNQGICGSVVNETLDDIIKRLGGE